MESKELSEAALTAKVIKKRLSAMYPHVKFSVTSDYFSMGNSVDIRWTDGPPQDAVEAVTNQYQCGSFDGMEDIYNYHDINPTLGCHGAKYVMCERSLSTEHRARITEKMKEIYGEMDCRDIYYQRKMTEIEKEFFPYPEVIPEPDKTAAVGSPAVSGLDYEIIQDTDTRDDSEIFVVRVKTRVNNFNALRQEISNLGGYYSRFKRGFIFKEDPAEKLAGKTEAPGGEDGETEIPAGGPDESGEAEIAADGSNELETAESAGAVIPLLDKFASVEIKEQNRFPAVDFAFCKGAEETYKLAHALHTEIYEKAAAFVKEHESASSVGRKYVKEYGNSSGAGISSYKDSIVSDTYTFIGDICHYFAKKYNITVEEPEWKDAKNKKEDRLDAVPLEYILDRIHGQMGGMSFDEKALNEIKEKMKDCFYSAHNDSWNIAVSGSKLVFGAFYNSRKDSYYGRYEVTVKPSNTAFFEALTHFEYGEAYLHQKYNTFTGHYTIREETGIYDRHMISSAIISSVKVFKNGRVEIAFLDYAKARQFARDYCGYTEQKAG